MKKIIVPFIVGVLLGGLVGGIAGYVINDLTSQENEEVVAEMEEAEAQQASFEDFLNNLPAPDATPAATPAEGSN
jgi:gas vesicle protein